MLYWLIVILLEVSIFAAGYIICYDVLSIQKLKRNQIEWENIKSNISDEKEIRNAYVKYIDMLYRRESTSWLGSCFPKM